MKYHVECPFCGEEFYQDTYGRYIHPANTVEDEYCPLAGWGFSEQQWNMRPPKKEVGSTPAPAITSEVEWLRKMVERLSLEKTVSLKPNEIMERGE